MQAANAMEVQRNVVVRTKSGSFTKNKPGAWIHCRFIGVIRPQPAHLVPGLIEGHCACQQLTRFAASQIRAMGPGLPLNSVLYTSLAMAHCSTAGAPVDDRRGV